MNNNMNNSNNEIVYKTYSPKFIVVTSVVPFCLVSILPELLPGHLRAMRENIIGGVLTDGAKKLRKIKEFVLRFSV